MALHSASNMMACLRYGDEPPTEAIPMISGRTKLSAEKNMGKKRVSNSNTDAVTCADTLACCATDSASNNHSCHEQDCSLPLNLVVLGCTLLNWQHCTTT